MGTPARFPFGISSMSVGKNLGSLLGPSPIKLSQFFCDFSGLDYNAAAWTVTETDAASTQALVAASAGGEYGLLALVQAGTGATAVNSIQLATAPIFITDLTKRWWLQGRVSRDNADEGMGFGVQAVNATPFTISSGIFAHIIGASTGATFTIGKAAALTTATKAAVYPTSSLDTFISLGMAYNGRNRIDCYVNDSKVTEITTLTNLPNTVALTPTVSSLNTTANARNVHCDYFFFAVER